MSYSVIDGLVAFYRGISAPSFPCLRTLIVDYVVSRYPSVFLVESAYALSHPGLGLSYDCSETIILSATNGSQLRNNSSALAETRLGQLAI